MIPSRLDDLGLRWKLIGNLFLVAMLLVVNVAGVWIFLSQQDHDGAVIDRAGRQRMLIQEMTFEAHRVANGDDSAREDLVETAAQYDRSLETLTTGNESLGVPPAPPSVRPALREVQTEWRAYRNHLQTVVSAPRESPKFKEANAYLQAHDDDLLVATDSTVQAFEAAFERKVTRLQWFLVAILGLDLLMLTVLYVFVSRRVIRPIDRLAAAAVDIAEGDHDRRIPELDADDEIGTLTRSIASMKSQLLTSLRRARGFQQAVEHAGAAIYLTDTDGTIQYVNPAFEDQTGYSRDEAVGRNPRILKSGVHGESFYRSLWETITSGNLWEGELVNATKHGDRYHVEQTIAPITDDGKIDRYVAMNHDITALKRLEKQLRTERDHFAALFENISEPVVEVEFVDDDPIVRDVNAAFVETFGFDRETVVGDSLDAYIIPDGAASEAEQLNAQCSRGDQIERTVQRITADGRRTFLLRSAAIDEENGKRCFGIYLDVTERRRREAELERQNERLEAFASVVSHDLRNPLNVASGSIDLVADECESEHLERSRRALSRMYTMIEDLLTMARTSARVENPEPVALEDVATDAWSMVETRESGATIRIADDLGRLPADRSRLQQLFENLFRNAVEHGGDDVTVTLGPLAERVGFYVADDGPGIPADEREQVFEAGYSTSSEGTGFGLNIVREIAEAHGWSVSASESTTGGARFDIETAADPPSSHRVVTPEADHSASEPS